jgi:hypothetical protein
MNPQHLPEFTGPRFHRRPLTYTQAPAQEYVQPLTARQCYPIERTPRPSRFIRHTLFSLAVGALVVAALVGCGDDIHTAQADAQAVADAKAHAVQLKQEWRELEALASLSGSKQ